MSKSKKTASKTDGSARKVEKGNYGLHNSGAPNKPEKPTPKTKGKK